MHNELTREDLKKMKEELDDRRLEDVFYNNARKFMALD